MANSNAQPLRGIILAAGQGKRMKSSLPKVLHDVLGQPILARVLKAVDALPLEEIHLIVGHEAEQIKTFAASVPLKSTLTSHLQATQLGTGHAVMQAERGLQSFAGTLIVLAGDTPLLAKETLIALVAKHQNEGADVSLLTARVPSPKGYGRILRDLHGHVAAIVEEKDATDEERAISEINPGVYCFQWPLLSEGLKGLSSNNQQNEYYLTDIIGWAVAKKLKLASYEVEDWHEITGVNSKIDLADATRFLNERTITKLSLEHGVTIIDPSSTWIAPEVSIGQDTVVLPGSWLVGNISIGRECRIGPHTVLEGAVEIGSRSSVVQSRITESQVGNACRIGPFAHLRPGTVLADEVKIGNFVEVKKSFVGPKASAGHLSYIGDATIGSNVNIGAGTITANYDHLTKQKNRTTIEDGASTGSNSVLVAPIVLGREASVGAGTVVTKDVPAEALALRRAPQEMIAGWAPRQKRKLATTNKGSESK